MSRILTMSFVFSVALGASAADFERRMIPVAAASTAGAHGTVWTTRATIVADVTQTEIIGLIAINVPPVYSRAFPNRVALPFTENEPPGTVLYIPRDDAPNVHFTATLMEHERSQDPWSAPPRQLIGLPVVRESDFVNRTIYFADLTKDVRSRRHLRVYSLDLDDDEPVVRVRMQAAFESDPNPWDVVAEAPHRLTAVQRFMTDYQGTVSLPVRPLALELDLDSLLAAVPDGAAIAVSVVPPPGLRIWALVSETNNETQRVRLVLPD